MAQPDHDDARGFIPDLCNWRAILGMLLVAECLALGVELMSTRSLTASLWRFGFVALFMLWVLCLSLAAICPARRWLGRLYPMQAALLVWLWVLLTTLAVTWLAGRLLDQTLLGAFFRPPVPGDYLINGFLASMLTFGLLRYFWLQSELSRQRLAGLQARLDALQARIEPHFLYNALNSISSLVHRDPDMAEQAVVDLSDLLRAAFGAGGQHTLADELALVQRYLALEHLRFGDRLQLHLGQPDALPAVQMPVLSLQPLVENAIKHGIATLPGGGCLELTISPSPGRIDIDIRNPVPAHTRADRSHQEGQYNALVRLRSHFGDRLVSEMGREDGHYRVHLGIPLE
jgi:two-component system sensor histidine kinase AlgZ